MAMSKPICIVVRSLSGKELLQIDVQCDVTVGGLKRMLAERLQIAPLCQQLVLDDNVLEDECACCFSHLREVAPAEGQHTMTLSLVVNVEAAYAQLQSREFWARMEGVRALACAGLARDSRSTDAILGAINDCSPVRAAALEALAFAVPRGTLPVKDLQTHVLPRLEDSDPAVCMAVAEALCSLADVGDATVILALLQQLAKGDSRKVKKEYVRALGLLAPRGHESAIQAVCLCAKNVDAQVRREAVGALVKLAPRGHEGGTQLCVEMLAGDWQKDIKHAALAALDVLALEGDLRVTNALCTCIETQFEDLRTPALLLLSRIAPPCSSEAKDILQEYAQELQPRS